MTQAWRRDHDRSASPRWGWLVVVVGLVIAIGAAWLEYTDRPTAPGALASTGPPRPRTGGAADDATPTRSTPTVRKPAKASTGPILTRPGRPNRIVIPALGITARVLGIKARGGSLIPPANPKLVGWWSDGAQPGARKGSAVITGHTVHSGGGAFDDIDELDRGAPIVVRTARGELRYEVTEIITYRKRALARHATKVFDQSVPGRLVLITCEDWDGTGYLSNAVIFARRTR